MLWIIFMGLGVLFIIGFAKMERKISGEVDSELKLKGIQRPDTERYEPEPEIGDENFADEIPSEKVSLTIGDQNPKTLKPEQDLRAIVDGLAVGEFVVLSRGHFHFMQAIHEADGFLMELREGRDHLQAEWQPRYGDRSPYFDKDVVAETLSAYADKRPMMPEIIWEPIAG